MRLENSKITYPHYWVKSQNKIDEDIEYYYNPKSDYLDLFLQYRKTLENKAEYINEIIRLGKKHRIALMCFEKDPNYCHRGQVGEELREKHYHVVSI